MAVNYSLNQDMSLINYNKFYNKIIDHIPADRIITDELRKLAFGTDASFYRLIPEMIIKVKSDDEVAAVIKTADSLNIPLTFRAAGTSLSGQSITDSVLVLLDNSWNNIKLKDDNTISLDPGVIGAHANARLSGINKKLGPDPASINSCKIAGIAANNASGMTSGTKYNIYNTLQSMRIILADGTILDTGSDESKKIFSETHPEFIEKVLALAEQVKTDEQLSSRISKKYRIKNTTGYGLNSLTDFVDPFDIISHLMIGSEGTLGFISNITLKTVDNLPYKASALIIFKDINTACKAIPIFNEQAVDAAEIMDRAALRSVEDKPGMPGYLKTLGESAAVLLIETSSDNSEDLKRNITDIKNSISNLEVIIPVEFTSDPIYFKKLWDVRKGLFPSVCKDRKPGSSVIIEDVNFPTEQLAEAALDLQKLFKKYHYTNTIIWGHALAGNLHFVFTPDFSSENEITLYNNFMNDIAVLVVDKYDGSLKAEHGTGRNMAPFVRYEWGEKAYDLMKSIKNLFDPKGILNPGVLINDDPKIHLKNIKPLPIANPLIDQCIECGFCEVNCPSKDITITPRQRIVAWREIQRLRSNGNDFGRTNKFVEQFNYYGDATCATDGLCALSCPVDIDTGKLVKELRASKISPSADSIASFIARNMNLVTSALRMMLNSVYFLKKLVGRNILAQGSSLLSKISFNKIPVYTSYLPKGSKKLKLNSAQFHSGRGDLKVVYFPSCITRTMGIAEDYDTQDSLPVVTERLLKKAGYEVIYPDNINNLCCGMAFDSKGFVKQGKLKANELLLELKSASNNWQYPVLFDMSPCYYRIKEFISGRNGEYADVKIYEQVEFINDFLLDILNLHKLNKSVAVHVTCSSTKLGLEEKFKNVAAACVDKVIIPDNIGCCGFAGDRGFSYPELNQSALKDLKISIPENCNEGYSNSRTCEIGLSEQSGINYKSIVYLVDQASSRMESEN